MWNLNTLPNVIGLYGLLLVALVIGVNGVIRRVELWSSGQPSPEHSGHWLYRLDDLIQYGFFHKKVARSSSNGSAMAHLLVYLGFLVLFFTTTMVFIHHDLGIEIYKGQFYLYVTMFSDIFGLLMLAGILFFGYRRFIEHADTLHNSWNSIFILAMLALLVVQGFLLEGLRIHATDDPWALYSPIGWLVAKSLVSIIMPSRPQSLAESRELATDMAIGGCGCCTGAMSIYSCLPFQYLPSRSNGSGRVLSRRMITSSDSRVISRICAGSCPRHATRCGRNPVPRPSM